MEAWHERWWEDVDQVVGDLLMNFECAHHVDFSLHMHLINISSLQTIAILMNVHVFIVNVSIFKTCMHRHDPHMRTCMHVHVIYVYMYEYM